ncbi:MAG: protein O-mannosyl-transferase family [Chthoniobacterales bacterium]
MSILDGRDLKPWVGASVVAAAVGILYLLTAARDIIVGDSPELITAAVTLGVAHAPGYPLFTMLGHLFSLVPFGPLPFRVNLLSVVCDAFTVGVVYFSAFRLSRSQLAAAIAALLLAVNPTFWEWSLAAEVFPLNNLLAAILVLFLITWHEQPERSVFLIAAFFVAGLALTNHQTIVLLAPAFAFVLWQGRSSLRVRLFALGLIAFVIGLLPYAYIPWAAAHHPVHNWGNVSSFHDFAALITRRSYGSTRLISTPGYTGGSPWMRLAALGVSFGLVNGLLIILGAIRVFQQVRWYFWFSLAAFIFAGPFFVWITGLNLATAPSALFVLQRFFLLSDVALAPLVAFGVVALAQFVARSVSLAQPCALRVVTATCVTAVVINIATNYRRIDQSRNFIARQFGEDIFNTIRPGSILLVSGDGLAFPLMYLQEVENVGKETTLVVLPLLLGEWHVRQLREQHPDLMIPFDRYDPPSNNLQTFVAANQGRTIALAGTAGNDHSLDTDYWPYQQGLLALITPRSQDVPLDLLLAENEQLLGRCHPPAPGTVRANTFEEDILSVYAYPPFNLGGICERSGLKAEARSWYKRALAINPQLSKAREGLARLEH